MIVVGYIVVGFAFIRFIISLFNFIFRQKPDISKKENGFISVIIPVRNEEKNIGNLLNDLHQISDNNLEIIVFDDESEDNTSKIVRQFQGRDNRIKLFQSAGLPQGWLGKNHACYKAAQRATGDYLLFLDADVRIKNYIPAVMAGKMKQDRSGLLSVFPTQIMQTWGEKWTVPLMHSILLSLLPLILVKKSRKSSLAAANGQFMLFDATIYHTFEPHKIMKNHKVEDIAIARYLKQHHIGVTCLTGIGDIKCRMYEGFREASEGFSKNIFMFFGNSKLLTLIFWLVTTFGFIAVVLQMKLLLVGIYAGAIILTRIFISLTAKQNIADNLFGIIPQQISLGIIIFKAFNNQLKKTHQWKARNISFLA